MSKKELSEMEELFFGDEYATWTTTQKLDYAIELITKASSNVNLKLMTTEELNTFKSEAEKILIKCNEFKNQLAEKERRMKVDSEQNEQNE